MSNIRSLGDLNKDNDHNNTNASDSSEDEDAQQFYAGGEKSGVAVQGPPKKPTDLIKDILGKAARGSQQQRVDEASQEQKPASFTGAGYRLGSEDEPATSSSSSAPQVQPFQQAPERLEHVERRLTFWADGFTVEDGPLMRYDDPANEEALQAINSGRAPIHLLNVQPGQPVDVRVDHRMKEPWSEAAAKTAFSASGKKPSSASGMKAFSGTGNRLGGVSESVSSSSISSIGMPGSFSSEGSSATSAPPPAASAPPSLTIDPSQPVTSIQIRLADGTRMVARMNHTHTIGDLRSFINASRPGEGARTYAIMTTFPNRDLVEEGMTLKEAGLVNAVVVQRML